ncbi:hypothetical protein [Limosilactobacillus agrestimuris]|uniref:hypothetical protein n=1 Tax=Limosilactobacillus agrestimuris TaxID=2941331 RepID=UPI00203BEFDC|nr:hypothetical protein [Limosilactobacillus agrestimuris]
MINKIIATLLTVGGMGYINLIVATQLGTVDIHKEDKTTAIAYSAMWSIVDFAIYLIILNCVGKYLKGDWLLVATMILTIVVSFLVAIIISPLLKKLVYFLYNSVLHVSNKPGIDSGTVWHHIMSDNNEPIMAYFYSFDHQPLGFGYVDKSSNDDSSNYSASLQPFNYQNPELQDTYNEMMKKVQDNEFCQKYSTRQFVDFKQQFIALIIQEK